MEKVSGKNTYPGEMPDLPLPMEGYRRVTIDCSKDGVTQQNMRDECDINTIVEKANKLGQVTSINSRQPFYGDVSKIPDYQSNLNSVIEAQNAFMSLDAKIRERFNNDPGTLIDFLKNPANKAEAIALGLVNPDVNEKSKVQDPAVPLKTSTPEGSK